MKQTSTHSSFNWNSNPAPLAIVMWDFSWLMNHYPTGSFEDFDECLDGLVTRGYDAVRLDCFPQLIADSDTDRAQESYFHKKPGMARELWQNPYSIHSRPRESLIEMLEGCRKRDIKYGLSSWFLSHGTKRSELFSGVASLVRGWNETLSFIADHGLLENVLYVDLLNEYPLWNGFVWLKDELARIGGQSAFECDDEKRNEPLADLALGRWEGYNQEQRDFYNAFINDAIAGVKKEWPGLKVFACETCDYAVDWSDTDRSNFDVMDIHLWFCYHKGFHEYTRYFQRLHTRENDHEYSALNTTVKKYWTENRDELTSWMDDEIGRRAAAAKKRGVPIGNTEGWGPINWEEHPYLDWDFAKDAARVAVSLARKHGYDFICSTNFVHPQFPSVWNDIDWHREITDLIRRPL